MEINIIAVKVSTFLFVLVAYFIVATSISAGKPTYSRSVSSHYNSQSNTSQSNTDYLRVSNTSTTTMTDLKTLANKVIQNVEKESTDLPNIVDPTSNNNTDNIVSTLIAEEFLDVASPNFLKSDMAKDDDRLVKIGRSIKDLVTREGQEEEGLRLLVDACETLASSDLKVPKVTFGKTNLQMPIVTLGCMRFQQAWTDRPLSQVSDECQANLVEILEYAICTLGINHIETARGYGCSEVQLGKALEELFKSGKVAREDLIIQTKVNPMAPEQFRKTLDTSIRNLKVKYIDLFSFHGLNLDRHLDIIFRNEELNGQENLIDVIKEYQAAGKVRHVGFSSHGQPELITKAIETDVFEYANIHYHAYGSYTASGGGDFGGNLQNVRLMKEKGMGVFIISPYDKGGRLYEPSKKLRQLTLPDLEALDYGSLWLWSHEHHDGEAAPIHTFTVGVARPSDLDEPVIAAQWYINRKEEMLDKVNAISKRLEAAAIEALGEEWWNSWWKGVPNTVTEDDAYQLGQIVSLYNMIKAWGMYAYAKDRYGTFDGNLKNWDFSLTTRENIDKMAGGWGYMPGIAVQKDTDYDELLKDLDEEKKEKVIAAIKFTHKYCSKLSSEKDDLEIPDDWQPCYDMRPWTAFPERAPGLRVSVMQAQRESLKKWRESIRDSFKD